MPPPEPSISLKTPPDTKEPATIIPATRKSHVPTTITVTPLPPRYTPYPRVVTLPRRTPQPRMTAPDETVAHHTISRQPISALAASNCTYRYKFIDYWENFEVLHPTKALAVLYTDTRNPLDNCQLQRHPILGPTWTTSYAKKTRPSLSGHPDQP